MRATLALIASAALALFGAAPAGAALDAETMFDPSTVIVIDLTMPPASIAALEADPEGEYVEGTFSWAETTGAPDGIGPFSAPITVGIRLKGDASFRDLSGKAAFKIKFSQFVKGQKFLGLKKLTLNNMVQDPSMLHEALAYETFRAAGVPAPETGYADVRLNGKELGVHLNIETIDETALEKRFGKFEDPPQHLYEGGFEVDLTPGRAGDFEADEGDPNDRSDLQALIAAVNIPGPPSFSARVAPFADLAEMTKMWAVEKYIGHWDGYSGTTKPHNYYLYSDPGGVFEMLPWGTDQAWEIQLGFDDPGGLLFEDCRGDATCAALYRAALEELGEKIGGLGLATQAGLIADRLRPWQALEEPSRRPPGASTTAAAVGALKKFLDTRPGELAEWLHPSPPPVPAGPAAAPPAVAGRLDLEIDRSRLGNGVLLHRAQAPAAGTIVELAEIATAGGPLRACRVEVSLDAPGPATLRCHLSAAVRRHLRARRVRLAVSILYRPDGGEPTRFDRTIVLPREVGATRG